MANADWYVPSVSTTETQLPEGLFITMFDAKNHVDEGLSSEQIKQEYEQNAKAVGEYVLSLSPERLALHETIVAMSLNLKFKSEDDFVAKFHKIYEEAVLPKIKDKDYYFSSMNRLRRRTIEVAAQSYFSDSAPKEGLKNKKEFDYYTGRFVKNYERYSMQLEDMKKHQKEERLTRAEREELKQLQKTVDFMQENKERIIIDLVANAVTLSENKRIVENIISGPDGVFASNYISQFEKLTQHADADRQSFLIVGGAASGKGSVTNAVKNEQADKNDLLEINPDLYKKLLLPFEEVRDYIELHGSLTHAESSIVFDSIAERWQSYAREGKAPNILMDVARAGNWQLGVLGTGNTSVSANTPMLPIDVALVRSYKRGEQTGRFMPTRELIQGHKDQIALNKNAMKKGINYRFYNTNVKFGEPVPLVANFDAKQSKMTVYDMGVMWDYFSKSQLNPEARNLEDLSFASPATTAKELAEHAEFMQIDIRGKDKTQVAELSKKDGKIVCSVRDFDKLKENMGAENAFDLLVGLKQNNVEILANAETMALVEQRGKQNQNNSQKTNSAGKDVDCEQYADLLQQLVNNGLRVGKTEDAFVYDFANDPDLKDKQITIGTQNLDVISQEAAVQSYNDYDPKQESKRQKVLIIDAKVYNTAEKREKLISRMKMMLATTGRFEAEGIYMNERRKITDDYLFENSGKPEIQSIKPNPDAVRVAYKISDKAVKIPVQWGDYTIEKDGSVVVREKDMQELKKALTAYQSDKNPDHLLQPDGKAKFDVYGTDPFFVEDNYSNIYSDDQYRKYLNKMLNEGEKFEPKNSTKYDEVIAYKIKKEDKIVTPDGVLQKAGDWLCISAGQSDLLRKQLDNNEAIGGVYCIKEATMQKSYNVSKQNRSFVKDVSKSQG